MNKTLTFKNVEIKVRKGGLDSGLVRLKLDENLSSIRQELEKVTLMNDTLLFSDGTSRIQERDERKFLLSQIIKTIEDDKILYLVKNPSLDYDLKILKDKFQLEYGRKINSDGEIDIAKGKAFILDVRDFKVRKGEGMGIEKSEVTQSEYNKQITESTINDDINAKFGLSYGKSKNTMTGSEKKLILRSMYINKISLKIERNYFKPTEEFIDEVENAIKIKDHEEKLKKFKDIAEKFGQFISSEVLIGGKAYFLEEEKSVKFSEEKNKIGSTTVEDMSSKNKLIKLIGGERDNLDNFNERAWVKSLDDFVNWGCIEYKNLVSIFQLLPYELYKRIFRKNNSEGLKGLAKRILYSDQIAYIYSPNSLNKRKTFELTNIPTYMLENDAECNIFATVIDTDDSKNDFFSCQILLLPNRRPQLMIHCIQKYTRNTKYNLKVGLVVVGYDINFNFINSDSVIRFEVIENKIEASKSMYYKKLFYDSFIEEPICLGIPVLREPNPSLVIGHHFFNYQGSNGIGIGSYIFSYSLEKNHYVELPEFTFSTLIISNYPDCNEYKIIPFNCKNSILDKLFPFNFKNSCLLPNYINPHSSQSVIPKYISLHSSEDNCAPIFLKQKKNEIKIKYIRTEVCEDNHCICKKTIEVNDLKLHFFKKKN
ncbi:hypothetical protein GLOIN_2v936225 [Rhizophagus irregularis DAOM 181602=DAOM 197198]|uniref:DUF7431 domain-containing protein n=2 Tax=Rhizophagus irregularis TaxID=588596 RepID=A0A015IWX1_RHIIW|nr:hypothetical protein GLOIN_2v936225 [Rhizophagus irregularis DAOM 181602=DAOM 197198]EXX58825.1 hypothetical protein RirG_194370 [Rhizophagus irregularis DAOM 197198w]POG75862.1 hypothetical protein GLOIN_2v936225 [Rhizophagus irregularis DAOM 181602=DAOM 197198]GBC27545.1 hypothetical protein GLOIN_2v936225 [Rhizophagus irregularis DAOM 181602=DAOM 197198]|eukprot:XP_025182728.1 hypothetical protein GLOIN_2v936225 [Rhizophagus irregularis DAOM 181602=DAOM 197198]